MEQTLSIFATLQLFRICWLFENDPDYPDSIKSRHDTSQNFKRIFQQHVIIK